MSKKDEPTTDADLEDETQPPRPTEADYDSVPFSNDTKGVTFDALNPSVDDD